MTSPITTIEPARRRSVLMTNKILCKIIFYTLCHLSGRVIQRRYFDIMAMCNLFETLGKLLRVSWQFHDLTKPVFCGLNTFKFPVDCTPCRRHVTKHGNPPAPFLPPTWAISSLQRITLEIGLMDSRLELIHPVHHRFNNPNRHEPREVIYFRSIRDLYRYCPGARVLHLLTDYITELTVLGLHIFGNFRNRDKRAAIDLYRAAGFKVHADQVNVRVSSLIAPSSPQKQWYPDLIKVLNIE